MITSLIIKQLHVFMVLLIKTEHRQNELTAKNSHRDGLCKPLSDFSQMLTFMRSDESHNMINQKKKDPSAMGLTSLVIH